jgi:ankyrin repeat protein
LLLSRGADACREDKDGRTPLHSFFNEAIGQVIQCHQDDIDLASQDNRGMTALHWASWSSRSSPEDVACRTTRQHDPTFEARDVHGKSLLHFAVERGNLAVVDYLMLQPCAADMALPDYSGCTLLHYATANARVLLIDFLIDCKGFDPMVRDNHGRTLLHHAAMRDNFDAVKHLFDLGIARPESLDQDGRTALQLALSRGSTSVVKYLQTYCDTSAVEHFEKADEVSIAIGVQSTRKAAQSLSLAKATTLALLLSFLYWYQLQRVSNSRLS